MKTKKELKRNENLKLILAFAFLTIALISFESCGEAVTNEEKMIAVPSAAPPPPPSSEDLNDSAEEPYTVVDEMPVYPGGDTELINYISKNTIYPPEAKKNNIQGRVIVKFCITTKGEVSNVSIEKGVDILLDTEAVRVIKTVSNFTPGKQNGKIVPVWYMVPITFALRN